VWLTCIDAINNAKAAVDRFSLGLRESTELPEETHGAAAIGRYNDADPANRTRLRLIYKLKL
jgi:hypothetical protein